MEHLVVYHIDENKMDRETRLDVTMSCDKELALKLYKEGKYKGVAQFEADKFGLEDTFRFTNHIDKVWFENMPEGAEPCVGKFRSTSVGDIVVHYGNNGYTKAIYFVDRFGFDEL